MLNAPVPAAAPGLPNAPSRRSDRSHLYVSKPVYDAASASRIVIFRADLPSFPSPLKGLTATAPRITAVFPCEPAMDGLMLGFTRAEGHMSCSRLWFDMSRPASPAQYAYLAGFLRAKGHTLDIRHRITPAMETTRAWRWKAEREEAAAQDGRGSTHARSACFEAMDISAAVSGIDGEKILRKSPGSQPVGLARAGAIWISHHVFGLPLEEVAEVFGRKTSALRKLLKGAEGRRETDQPFALALSMMEHMARERLSAPA